MVLKSLVSVQFSSVAQSCPTLGDPMICSTLGLPVYNQRLESKQTHVHQVGDAIQPSHPLLSLLLLPSIFPSIGSFQMSQLFASGGQSIRVSASTSFLPKKSQGWSHLEWIGWICMQYKGLSRVFSNTTVQKCQFFGAQSSLWTNSHIHTWLLKTISSVQSSRSVISNSLRPHGLQHARLPCPSPSPGSCSNSCALSRWHYPTISSSVIPFSSCLQSFPTSESFPVSQFFTSHGQNIGASASASVLPMNIQDWFPLELTGLISFQSEWPSRVFSNTTVQKHQFFITQISLWSNPHIHTWLLEKP